MKKPSVIIVLVLAFACMLSLAACGGNTAAPSASTPPASSAPPPASNTPAPAPSDTGAPPPASTSPAPAPSDTGAPPPDTSAPASSSPDSSIPSAGDWLNIKGPLTIKHIGISFESLQSDFAAELITEIKAQLDSRGWTYDLNEANENSMTQVQQCEDMIAKGIDALLLKPNDESSFASISQLCQEQNIPLLVLGDYLTSPYTIASLSDDYHNGVIQAQYLMQNNPGTLHKVFVLRGPMAAELFNLRAQGAMDTLQAAGYEIVYSTATDPMQDQAITATENFLATSQEIDAIVCGTDSQAIGAGIAVKEAGLSDKIFVMGIDGQAQGAQAILDGSLNGTLYLPPPVYADTLFAAFDKLVAGQPYDQNNTIQAPFMGKDNVHDFYPDVTASN